MVRSGRALCFQVVTLLLLASACASTASRGHLDLPALRRELWEEFAARTRSEHAAEVDARELVSGDLSMRFSFTVFGKEPPGGRSLFLSLHGGGSAPVGVNDEQWENQKTLYTPDEGIYLAPRAPTDAWNMWHQAHMDGFLDRLITDMIVFERVDPDRVYLMGYSAGGDGVYQLAPRMADRFGAAAMMAGHPNETQPDSLRNLPFALWVGEKDDAYDRNTIARRFGAELDALRAADPRGYEHWVELPAGKGHWMDHEDAVTVPWMAHHRRNLRPDRIVWLQDDVVNERLYWLRVEGPKKGDRIIVSRSGNIFEIEQVRGVGVVWIRMDESMVDFDADIVVRRAGRELFRGRLEPSAAVLKKTLLERGDPEGMWCVEVRIDPGLNVWKQTRSREVRTSQGRSHLTGPRLFPDI